MGCGASAPDAAQPAVVANPYASPPPASKNNDPKEVASSSGIDRNLDRARQQEELKVKLLLLGAGESGKSTIFKQMRILHGSPRSEDDLRMYGVVVRSNIITAMKKLCSLLRSLGLESQLAEESPPESHDDTPSGMTPKEAYDLLVAHLVDNTGNPSDLMPVNGDVRDWVGESARAGLGANNDAKLFLTLWKPIKTLWEVREKTKIYLMKPPGWGWFPCDLYYVLNHFGGRVMALSPVSRFFA
jgi:hypothetical protein